METDSNSSETDSEEKYAYSTAKRAKKTRSNETNNNDSDNKKCDDDNQTSKADTGSNTINTDACTKRWLVENGVDIKSKIMRDRGLHINPKDLLRYLTLQAHLQKIKICYYRISMEKTDISVTMRGRTRPLS